MITLNAWSCGFRNDKASVQGATPRSVQWVYDRETFAGVTVFEDGAMWAPGAGKVRSTARVGWLHEPYALHPWYYDRAVAVRHQYECILTHYQPLIDAYPDSFRFTVHGGVSVPREQWGLHPKSRNVAMLLSNKDTTPNHLLRHRIARELQGIDVYRDLYGGAKLDTLKAYRFLVVVENSSEPNWWTEHLLDAMALGMVPLYYWPNSAANAPHSIERYFDIGGIWVWADDELPDIVDHANEFGEDAYRSFTEAGQRNMELLPAFLTPEDWFVEHAIGDLCCQPSH